MHNCTSLYADTITNLLTIPSIEPKLITETRILRDVFKPADFDTKHRQWDRHLKTEFIQRLIDYAARNNFPVTSCVAAKVVAGLEPNKTLELLQALAKIAKQKLAVGDGKKSRTFTKSTYESESLSNSAKLNSNSRRSSQASTRGSVGIGKSDSISTSSINGSLEQRKFNEKLASDTHQESDATAASNEEHKGVTSSSRSRPPPNRRVSHELSSMSTSPVFDENSLSQNLLHLRANLKVIQTNLVEICNNEDALRAALTIALGGD